MKLTALSRAEAIGPLVLRVATRAITKARTEMAEPDQGDDDEGPAAVSLDGLVPEVGVLAHAAGPIGRRGQSEPLQVASAPTGQTQP